MTAISEILLSAKPRFNIPVIVTAMATILSQMIDRLKLSVEAKSSKKNAKKSINNFLSKSKSQLIFLSQHIILVKWTMFNTFLKITRICNKEQDQYIYIISVYISISLYSKKK